MVRTQIQLTSSQVAELKRLAVARGVSMAAVIREAIDAYLAREAGPSWEERVERVRAACSRYASGLDDLAENHDEYFVEAVEAKWK